MSGPEFRANRPSLLGVLYAEDFDDEGGGSAAAALDDPVPEPEIIEPMFSAAELETARAEARAAGRTDAERSLAASRVQMLGLIANGVADGRAGAHAAAMEVAESIAKCMLGTLVACLPALCEQHGPAEVTALSRAVLPGLMDEPKVIVRINPQMVPAMQEEVASLDIELAERVQLLPTEAVHPGDARISWGDGSVIRNAGRTRQIVEDALAGLGLLQREVTHA